MKYNNHHKWRKATLIMNNLVFVTLALALLAHSDGLLAFSLYLCGLVTCFILMDTEK